MNVSTLDRRANALDGHYILQRMGLVPAKASTDRLMIAALNGSGRLRRASPPMKKVGQLIAARRSQGDCPAQAARRAGARP